MRNPYTDQHKRKKRMRTMVVKSKRISSSLRFTYRWEKEPYVYIYVYSLVLEDCTMLFFFFLIHDNSRPKRMNIYLV